MQQEDGAAAPDDIGDVSIMDTLTTTVAGFWQDTIERMPFLVAGLVVLIATWLVKMLVEKLADSALRRANVRTNLRQVIVRLIVIGIWVIGFMIAAMVIFPGLTPAKVLGALGIASVAIGFAFKDIFENFFAGILLLWKFPFEDGDFIECEDIKGKVEEVTIRMSKIRQTDGVLVVLPNSYLFKNPVYVLTTNDQRRTDLMVGIGYDEKVEEAIPVIEKALQSCETVNQDRGFQIFPKSFGASSVDIEVAWWCDATPLGVRKSRGEVVPAIKQALDEAGIEIPYPYRTLTFRENSPVPLDTEQLSGDDKD